MNQFRTCSSAASARLQPCHLVPEVCAGGRKAQRPRQCGLHEPPPYVLRDARQLLLRRLLQGGGNRLRVELLVDVYGLPVERLWFTVYTDDDDAARLWEAVGAPRDRILRFGEKENFWAMGETGPCGPVPRSMSTRGTSSPETDRSWSTGRATRSSRSGTSSSCSTSGTRPGTCTLFRGRASTPGRTGASRRRPPRGAVQLRHGSLHAGPRAGGGVGPTALRARGGVRTGVSGDRRSRTRRGLPPCGRRDPLQRRAWLRAAAHRPSGVAVREAARV